MQSKNIYYAYGLTIHSEICIPEFVCAELDAVASDVTVCVKHGISLDNYLASEILNQYGYLNITLKTATVFVQGMGLIFVEDGNKIVIIPQPDASEEIIRLYLVGTVMAILLYQRGLLVLHGSAVEIEGNCAIFLGASGAGKSSTIAALNAHGYSIIADDVAAVNTTKKPNTVYPAFPQIKLGSELCTSLGYDFDSLHFLGLEEKRGYRLKQGFNRTPLPIRRIYTLAFGEEFSITPLKPQEAVIELIRHSRPTTLYHNGGASHFLQCAALAKECTIHRLVRPRNLSLLPELVKLVEEHVASDLAATIV
ncbi:serine kinase [Plectonema cf. radiosum LEGE 06105]|uniref:Serine kinase n=1 Tax=Plectonema cf. radiosum LEGE 06105 TaxID=945769 RepID=A0A8J7FF18_9CYAN|nr:serine kinase [Plectonema radiosum]MBE9213101.1 serine kinase [Plectonema cf. radiosum LEGE 06105]